MDWIASSSLCRPSFCSRSVRRSPQWDRVLARRVRIVVPDWRRFDRAHGCRRSAAAARRRFRDHASAGGIGRIRRTGWSTCSGSRVPPRQRRSAQVWFELKSSGLPALAVGLGVAMLIFLLFAISISVEIVRPIAVFVMMISGPTLLVLLSGNAFGIRRRQGRTYVSAFEMTQSFGTAQLVGLKLLVRTACLLVALIAVGVSIWASSSLVSASETGAGSGLLWLSPEFGDSFAGQMAYSYIAQAVITSVVVALIVASLAAFSALRARYPRPLLIAGSLLLLHGAALILLAVAEQKNLASSFLVGTIFAVTGWSLVVAIVDRNYLPDLERLCGTSAVDSLRVRRAPGLGGIWGGMADGAAYSRRAVRGHVCGGLRRGPVAGVAASTGRLSRALVAQPRPPYVIG